MKSEPTSKTTYSTKYFATAKKPFSYQTMSGTTTWEVGSRFQMAMSEYGAGFQFSKEGMMFETGPRYCYETVSWEYFTVTAEETARTVTTQTESTEVTPTEYWQFR